MKFILKRRQHVVEPSGRSVRPMPCTTHEWVVFSTALEQNCLMVQCVECGAMGTVDDPSAEEWAEAFHSPSRPYRWHDDLRVAVRGRQRLHVVRADNGHTCPCPSRHGSKGRSGYERFPAEIGLPDVFPTDEERQELEHLSELVRKSDLCSRLFPFFIHSFQQDTGREPTGAVKLIASRIEKIDLMGMHCSPSIVARVLREWAVGGNQSFESNR